MVLRDGQIVAQGVCGEREEGSGVPATLLDSWHIGSCTKAMTATLAAALVTDGKLRFESTVGEILGHIEGMHPAWRDVTLAQLLQHRSGADAHLPREIFMFHDAPAHELRRRLVGLLLAVPPGEKEKFLYSNSGYVIAGHMLERAGGDTWEQLMRQRLFGPLEMRSAGFGAPGSANVLDQPRGHRGPKLPARPGSLSDNPPAIGPAGTVHLSLADWMKFAALHLEGARAARQKNPEKTVIFGVATHLFPALHSPPAPGARYAMGWGVGSDAHGTGGWLAHDGCNTLWYASIWIHPERQLAIVATTNRGDRAMEPMIREVTEMLMRQFAPTPAPATQPD
jgi:CubicO group peptidase (beta-lactamase class C family)